MTEHLLSNSAAVPLQEQAAEEARLALAPHQARRDQLLASLDKVSVNDDEDLRRALDKIILSKALRENTDSLLEPIGTPYREATHAVRSVALTFVDPLKRAEDAAQKLVDGFRRRQREAAAAAKEAQRLREQELRQKAGLESPPEASKPITAADVRLPSVRSDYRGQVFDRKVVRVTITDPRALPDTVLKAPAVIAALEAAVRQLAKLTRDIPGATIADDQASSVKAG